MFNKLKEVSILNNTSMAEITRDIDNFLQQTGYWEVKINKRLKP